MYLILDECLDLLTAGLLLSHLAKDISVGLPGVERFNIVLPNFGLSSKEGMKNIGRSHGKT